MDIEAEKEKLEKREIEEYQKHPMINLGDSINRSTIWNLGELTRGSLLTRMITTLIILGVLFGLFLFCRN